MKTLLAVLILVTASIAWGQTSHCYSPNSYTNVCEFGDGTAHVSLTGPLGGGTHSFDLSKADWSRMKTCIDTAKPCPAAPARKKIDAKACAAAQDAVSNEYAYSDAWVSARAKERKVCGQ